MKNFKNVPNKYKTFSKCMEAISDNIENFQYIPDIIFEDKDNIYTMILFSKELITMIPRKYLTSEVINEILHKYYDKYFKDYRYILNFTISSFGISIINSDYLDNDFVLNYIDTTNIDEKFVREIIDKDIDLASGVLEALVKKNPAYFKILIENERTLNICICKFKELIEANNEIIQYVPEDMIDSNIDLLITNHISLKYIPDKYKTKKLYKDYFYNDVSEIENIPDKFIDRNMKKFLIDVCGIKFMNPKWFDYFLSKRALNNNIRWITVVPQRHISKKVIQNIIDDSLYEYIKYCPMNENLYKKAVETDLNFINYIDKKYLSTDFIIELIKSNYKISKDISDIMKYLDKNDINEAVAFTIGITAPELFDNYQILKEYKYKVFQYYVPTDTQIKFAFKPEVYKYSDTYDANKHYIYHNLSNKVMELDIHL